MQFVCEQKSYKHFSRGSIPVISFWSKGSQNLSEGSGKCSQPGVGSGHVRKEDRERKPGLPLWEGVWGTPKGNFKV